MGILDSQTWKWLAACMLLALLPSACVYARRADCGPVEQDPGKQDAGKQDAGKQDAGKQDAGKQDAGKQDPIGPTRGVTTGDVAFQPLKTERELPGRYRMKAHRFRYTQSPHRSVRDAVEISLVQFPSPVVTPFPVNNQVHCEFFQPIGPDGKPVESTPGVIVLHILGGDFELARAFCMAIVRRGSAALFLKMPYYGPRRPPGADRRMVSEDPQQTVEGMTQAILDIRRATAWLGAQRTVDERKLGVFGISLGGITGALATGVEPRLHNTCLMLAGGDVGRIIWESKETRSARDAWLAKGRTREEFERIVAEVDPVRLAHRARGRRILMLNAKNDMVVPREATTALWEAFDKPPIVWYEGGHYTAAWHILNAIKRVGDFYASAESVPVPAD